MTQLGSVGSVWLGPVRPGSARVTDSSPLQVTNEKRAVKMCRLELSGKNRDRWRREIQIMKKWVLLDLLPGRGSERLLTCPPSPQTEPHQRGVGPGRAEGSGENRRQRSPHAGHGVLLQGRPEEGEGVSGGSWVLVSDQD